MKFEVMADITFSKTFIVEAESSEEAEKKVDEILGDTDRVDICEDVDGWGIADKSITNVEGDSA